MIWNHSVVHNQILRRAKTSNGTLKINTRDVKQIVLPVAPKNEQKKITRLIQAIQQKVLALSGIQNAYETLKKSLMHDLLTGKVRTLPAHTKARSENTS
jgi:restriction endonuclease S subunit